MKQMLRLGNWRGHPILNGMAGFLFCVGTSALLATLLRNSDGARFAPLIILFLIPALSFAFGPTGVYFGIITGVFIFATFLFQPLHSLQVDSAPERTNLIFMVSIGIPAAYFTAFRSTTLK